MSLSLFEHGMERLGSIVRPRMLCAFDFDGTLAPIVKEPDRALVPVAVSRRLARLMEYARVAVFTGRSVADVEGRLGFTPDHIIGNHGLEGGPTPLAEDAYRRICGGWKTMLEAALEDRSIFEPGIWIEDKSVSLSVHYRLARQREQTETQLKGLFPALSPPPFVIGGKCVFNLLPSHGRHKAEALVRLKESGGAPTVLYVGSDTSDEDIFRLPRASLLTIRVEHMHDSAAEFHLHHRVVVVDLLATLITRLRLSGTSRDTGRRHDPASSPWTA